eukprot:gnl/TRDRNA2_/TRDRNA2_28184_c0_seq1.p1 gnl/TRDRNA2_/TRDRNA2_28184_c0~~gnl/TRDRNA2_/TRDRNA2_28184_c0_seq1.p1  ORF type:complete len:399 (-),score=63.94 gnl/TRDRNA2_/TRDRNA2_28184_c0_seq1:67-1263(-)
MGLSRRREPLGWDETAFQLWDQMVVWKPLGLPCVPLVGKYGPEYVPAVPFVVLRLPPACAAEVFPPALLQELEAISGGVAASPSAAGTAGEENTTGDASSDPTQFLLLVHPALPQDPGGIGRRQDEVSLSLHAWAFPTLEDLDGVHSTTLDVGVFPVEGVSPAQERHNELAHPTVEETSGGAPFGALRRRQVVIHHGCLSPDNCQVRISTNSHVCGFFSAAHLAPRKVATLHVVPKDEASEDALRRATSSAPDAATLRETLPPAIAELGGSEVCTVIAAALDRFIAQADAAAYAAGVVEDWSVFAPSQATGASSSSFGGYSSSFGGFPVAPMVPEDTGPAAAWGPSAVAGADDTGHTTTDDERPRTSPAGQEDTGQSSTDEGRRTRCHAGLSAENTDG